ncbi:hypothetical protein CSOJ01_13492 [Colletotrichum sojae]|uniref:SET domain-containing protein n=1 Tax=Colletotrichum sojae TaxID=2175907 RepID=A0A8H6MLA7_9PEZI|nr:hypothetical protein CSOJ01_13492 [Colletotrichum sojae]
MIGFCSSAWLWGCLIPSVLGALGNDRCDWNRAGPLDPRPRETTCTLPFGTRGPSDWQPWTHRPVCTSPKTQPRYCAFVKHSFRSDSGILILTSPEVAAGDQSLIEDFDPTWVEHGRPFVPLSPASFEVVDIPGKGFGAVANATIRAGEFIMREHPRILQVVSPEPERDVAVDRGEIVWVLEEGFVRLPGADQVEVFGLAKSTGGHPLEDVIRTNTFGVKFNDVDHYGLFPGVARINHACKPNAMTRFSPRTLAIEVFAYRDIQPGEELSISYTPLNMVSRERQQALQDWGFNCTCSLCGSGPAALAASDGRRARVQQALSALEDPWLRGSAALVAELADEAEQALEEEGLAAQKGELHGILAGVYADMGDGETAVKYAASAVEKLAHFAGYDDERTERARGFLGELGKVGGGGGS